MCAIAQDPAAHIAQYASSRCTALGIVDRIIGTCVEACAAFLVAAQIVVLFAGVVSRCVFHGPIVWSDELASLMFLWLAMSDRWKLDAS